MSESTRLQSRAAENAPAFAESESTNVMSPPSFQLTAAEPLQREEATEGDTSVTLKRGELTSTGEGSDAQTSHVHWPDTDASGVTLGKGYDIGSRTEAAVIEELKAAGMDEVQATKISKGAGLKGSDAGTWVTNNKDDVGEIALDVQYKLLATMLEVYTDNAKDVATSDTATKDGSGYYTNARGREINDGVDEGTYKMSEEQWNNLHPAMVEFLTDLKYQGGYYLYSRVAKVNKVLIENDGDQIEQFKAVAELFQSEDESLSYMDAYGKKIGEGTGSTENFYDQTTEDLEGASTRRNRIRLAYLKNVISALEAGKDVVFEAGEGETTSEPAAGESTLETSPEVVTPEVTPEATPTSEAVSGESTTPETYTTVNGIVVGVLNNKAIGSLAAIKDVQTMLKGLGFYSGTIDGLLTLRSGAESGTTRAIKAFQSSKGLKADGLVGPNTMSAIQGAMNAGKDDTGSSEVSAPMTDGVYVGVKDGKPVGSIEAIKEVQTMLKTLGHYSSTIDGLITLRSGADSGTTRAIKAFQASSNLTVDGLVGANTLSALKAAVSANNPDTTPVVEDPVVETPTVEETPVSETPTTTPTTTTTTTSESDTDTAAPVTTSRDPITISDKVGTQGPNKKADVLKIQGLLNRIGLGTVVDGGIGKATKGAIFSFQKAVGLGADGWVGPTGNTLKKMNETPDGAFSNSLEQVAEDDNAPKFNHARFDNPGKLMQCTDGTVMPPQFYGRMRRLIKNVNALGDAVNVTLHVNSGYRSPNYNAGLEGSAQASNHQFGEAIDISSTGMTSVELRDKVLELIASGKMEDGGLGIYNTFIHYDVGGAGRRWDYR